MDFKFPQPETEVCGVLDQDTVTEQLVQDIALKPVEVSETYSHGTAGHSCTGNPDEDIESQILSRLGNSDHQVQDEQDFKGEDVPCDVQTSSGYISGSELTEAASVVPLGRSEEEQFPFSDSDELNTNKVQCMESSSSPCIDGEASLLCSPDGSKELNGSIVSTNYESYSSAEKFAEENTLTGFETSIGKLKATSTTIGIPRNLTAADKEIGRLVESLPNMWHQTDNLSALDLHYPLSHSLDSKVKTLKWVQQIKDDLGCIQLSQEQQLPRVKLDTENDQGTTELKDVPGSPAVGKKPGYMLVRYSFFQDFHVLKRNSVCVCARASVFLCQNRLYFSFLPLVCTQ